MLVPALLALAAAATRPAAAGPSSLAAWVGNYPTRTVGGVRRSLLDLPHVHAGLRRLLSPAEIRLLRSLEVEQPVEERDGYIVTGSCRAHDCGNHRAVVVLDRDGRALWISLYAVAPRGVALRVVGTAPWDPLPPEIRARLLAR